MYRRVDNRHIGAREEVAQREKRLEAMAQTL
jgi:hypothetical protein